MYVERQARALAGHAAAPDTAQRNLAACTVLKIVCA
jgi:hypothetical protein